MADYKDPDAFFDARIKPAIDRVATVQDIRGADVGGYPLADVLAAMADRVLDLTKILAPIKGYGKDDQMYPFRQVIESISYRSVDLVTAVSKLTEAVGTLTAKVDALTAKSEAR